MIENVGYCKIFHKKQGYFSNFEFGQSLKGLELYYNQVKMDEGK